MDTEVTLAQLRKKCSIVQAEGIQLLFPSRPIPVLTLKKPFCLEKEKICVMYII